MITGKRKCLVPGFEDQYEINEAGRIRVLNYCVSYPAAFKELPTRIDRAGYLTVHLNKFGKTYTKFLHRILAEAFLKNPKNKPFINHKDGNKLNNSLPNLEFVTHGENVLDAYRNGLNSRAIRIYDQISGTTFQSITQAALYCNLPYATCYDRLTKGQPGFRLMYLKEKENMGLARKPISHYQSDGNESGKIVKCV